MTELDNSLRLSPEQQAPLVAKLQAAEFRERDMPIDLLGAGLWIAYAVLALVWFRRVAQRRTSQWLATVRERVVAALVTRQMARGLESVQGRLPRAQDSRKDEESSPRQVCDDREKSVDLAGPLLPAIERTLSQRPTFNDELAKPRTAATTWASVERAALCPESANKNQPQMRNSAASGAEVAEAARRERVEGLTGSITKSQSRRRCGFQDFQAQVQSDPGFKKNTVPNTHRAFQGSNKL